MACMFEGGEARDVLLALEPAHLLLLARLHSSLTPLPLCCTNLRVLCVRFDEAVRVARELAPPVVVVLDLRTLVESRCKLYYSRH